MLCPYCGWDHAKPVVEITADDEGRGGGFGFGEQRGIVGITDEEVTRTQLGGGGEFLLNIA
jgi:hypothetical protein